MTLYELSILIHYRASGTDHPDMVRNPPMWRPTIDWFVASGLLQSRPVNVMGVAAWVLTARGHVFVDALQAVPLPEATWVMRWPKGER